MTREEAESRAIAEMGDAGEIGKELARIHRPWLEYLWTASKWAARLMIAGFLVFCVATHDYYSSVEHPLWGNRAESYGPAQSQKAELGATPSASRVRPFWTTSRTAPTGTRSS